MRMRSPCLICVSNGWPNTCDSLLNKTSAAERPRQSFENVHIHGNSPVNNFESRGSLTEHGTSIWTSSEKNCPTKLWKGRCSTSSIGSHHLLVG